LLINVILFTSWCYTLKFLCAMYPAQVILQNFSTLIILQRVQIIVLLIIYRIFRKMRNTSDI
jgi:hypothetical protein